MVNLDIVHASNTKLVHSHPLVAVFVGGTSGIGEYTLRALAATHGKDGKGLRAYIVGRKAAAAEKTIAHCASICPKGQFLFVKAGDLSLMKDVDRVCAEITQLEKKESAKNGEKARIDVLVMSQHYFPLLFEPRKDTSEGLDTSVSLLYYSRIRTAQNLLPLLTSSSLPTGARIISIYAAGKEASLHPSDLSLRNPELYNISNVRSHVVYMKTFSFEKLAEQNPGKLSCVHIYPSLVMTEGFNDPRLPLWFRATWWMLGPFVKWFSTPGNEIGERVLFLATGRYPAKGAKVEEGVTTAKGTDGTRGGGAYAVNWDDETVENEKKYRKVREEGLKEKVWEHTMSAFGEIEAGRVFTG